MNMNCTELQHPTLRQERDARTPARQQYTTSQGFYGADKLAA